MAGRVSPRLRRGAAFLRVGGFAQLVACGLAVIMSILTLLVHSDPNQEPPGIAVVAFLWFPAAALFGTGGLLSIAAARRARQRQAGWASLLGFVGAAIPGVALLAFAGPWDIPFIVVGVLLLPPMASLGGAVLSVTSPERRRPVIPDTAGP